MNRKLFDTLYSMFFFLKIIVGLNPSGNDEITAGLRPDGASHEILFLLARWHFHGEL